MKTCPFSGCTRRIPSRFFCCKPHFFDMPWDEKQNVNELLYLIANRQISKTAARKVSRNIVARVEGCPFDVE